MNPRASFSLSKARANWHPRTHAIYDFTTDSGWESCTFVARPLSTKWAGSFQSVLAISPSRLIVGSGRYIYSYSFGVPKKPSDSPPIYFEGQVSLQDRLGCSQNITALTFIHDNGSDCSIDVGFQDGSIERVYLSAQTSALQNGLSIKRCKLQSMPRNDFVESLCFQSETILALSSNGSARLSSLSGDTSSIIELKRRSWTSYLSLASCTPYAAFGTYSSTPLTIHPILDGGHLSSQPSAILHTSKSSVSDLIPCDQLGVSAVYGLSQAPLNSPWGSSPQILVSGWYDGQVRIYDLRSPSSLSVRQSLSSSPDPAVRVTIPVHRPVMSLVDRWCYEPVYAVAAGGGSAAHVAAGTARHSVVSFWDVRQPITGWSVHAPGNDPSPVYSVILESSRFFGVTQSRPFVYDFVIPSTLAFSTDSDNLS